MHSHYSTNRAISSAGSEHLVYTEGVGGSNPSSPTKNFNRNVGVFFMFKNKSFIGRWFFRLLSELIAHQKLQQKCWSFFMFKHKNFIGRWFFRLLSELIAHQKLQQKCWSFFMFKDKSFIGRWFFRLLSELIVKKNFNRNVGVFFIFTHEF